MGSRDERQDSAFSGNRQAVGIRHHVNRVDRSRRQPVDGVEHLKRSNEIQFVHRGHEDDDDAAAGRWSASVATSAVQMCDVGTMPPGPGILKTNSNDGAFRSINVRNRSGLTG
jgi:hypothetical protein